MIGPSLLAAGLIAGGVGLGLKKQIGQYGDVSEIRREKRRVVEKIERLDDLHEDLHKIRKRKGRKLYARVQITREKYCK